MVCSDWINLVAAIIIGGGTLALAYMAWKSIRNSIDAQNRERLNEIIEWTTRVTECGVAKQFEPLEGVIGGKTEKNIESMLELFI